MQFDNFKTLQRNGSQNEDLNFYIFLNLVSLPTLSFFSVFAITIDVLNLWIIILLNFG